MKKREKGEKGEKGWEKAKFSAGLESFVTENLDVDVVACLFVY